MSQRDIDKINERIAKRFDQTIDRAKQVNPSPHIFYLLDLEEEYKKIFRRLRVRKPEDFADRVSKGKTKAAQKAKEISTKMPKIELRRLRRYLKEDDKALIDSGDAYIIPNYSRGYEIRDVFIKEAFSDLGERLVKRITKRTQLGHGSSRSLSVNNLRTQSGVQYGIKQLQDEFSEQDVEQFLDSFVQKVENSKDISDFGKEQVSLILAKYRQRILTTGGIAASYIFSIALENSYGNQSKSSPEREDRKLIKDLFLEEFKDFSTIRGSSNLEEKSASFLIEKIKPKVRIKNGKIVIRVDPKYNKVDLDTKASAKYTSNKSRKPEPTKKGYPKKPRVRVASGQKIPSVLPDLRQFIGILNSRLSGTVAKNMGTPRLNYRTGRFAESVRVEQISKTSKGFPSIQYTYMRYPYEVFEFPGSGSPLAQQGQRDPRNLIDLSIREIMAEYAIGRFYTRRV
jgi:hypothetical protein